MTQPTHEDLLRRMDQSEQRSALAREGIAGALGRIETKLEAHGEMLNGIGARVTKLEADGNRRDGREGVLAALLRSPFVAWLAAVGAVAWAGLKSLSHAAAP